MTDELNVVAHFPPKLEALFKPSRYKVLYGGRGSAKSWGIARALLILGTQSPLRVLCAREFQISITDSVHRLLADQIEALGLSALYTVQNTRILGSNGTEFLFAGLKQNVNNLKSYEGCTHVWVEEAQNVSKRSWDVLVPTIRKEGSEIWVSFNPELETDETYRRFVAKPQPDSIVLSLNWRDNPWLPETLRREKDALAERDPDAYQNVWEGRCRPAVEGAIYYREIEAAGTAGRIRPVPHDPALPVHTVWDLGWNDKTSIILCQRLSSEVRVIGYLEGSHRTLAEYVADLRALPYLWGIDFLPHDAKQTRHQTGVSDQQVLERMGRKVEIVDNIDVEAGIRATRLVFPRVYFDDVKAVDLLDRLKRYRRAISSTTNEPGAPLHDDASHAADAFRYMALSVDRMTNGAPVTGDPYKAFRGSWHG